MKTSILLFVSLWLILSNVVLGQNNNLLLNGNFEELILFDSHVNIDGQRFAVKDTSPFYSLGKGSAMIPVSARYWSYTDSTYVANAFIENTVRNETRNVFHKLIMFHFVNNKDYYSSVAVDRMCKPLEKEKEYELSFDIRLLGGNTVVNEIDVCVIKNPIPYVMHNNIKKLILYLTAPSQIV